jgi:hypothetical protein
MYQERWLPFRPEECPETVWEQIRPDGRRKVVEAFTALIVRAVRAATTQDSGKEASDDSTDS